MESKWDRTDTRVWWLFANEGRQHIEGFQLL